MNQRLKYSYMYEIGPMDFVSRDKGKGWRKDLTEYCEQFGILCLNPYEKPLNEIHGEHALEDDINAMKVKDLLEHNRFDEAAKRMKFVRGSDLRMCDIAHWVVAKLDFDTIMTGTLEEIVTCNRAKKPVIIWSSVPKNKIPPWYFGMLPHELFFETFDEVKEYIRHIHEDDNIDTLNRWVFFDLEQEIEKIGKL